MGLLQKMRSIREEKLSKFVEGICKVKFPFEHPIDYNKLVDIEVLTPFNFMTPVCLLPDCPADGELAVLYPAEEGVDFDFNEVIEPSENVESIRIKEIEKIVEFLKTLSLEEIVEAKDILQDLYPKE